MLADVLGVDLDDAEGIPRFIPNWQPEDKEKVLLVLCSSLVTIAETGDTRIVVFSYIAVKKFLISGVRTAGLFD